MPVVPNPINKSSWRKRLLQKHQPQPSISRVTKARKRSKLVGRLPENRLKLMKLKLSSLQRRDHASLINKGEDVEEKDGDGKKDKERKRNTFKKAAMKAFCFCYRVEEADE